MMLARPMLMDEHARWIEEVRKISSEIAADMGAVTVDKNLGFEFRRNGVVHFRKVRIETRESDGSSAKRFFITPSGSPLILFNEDDATTEPSSPGEFLVVTEGEFDAMAFKVAGAPRAVSVPNGSNGRPSEGDIYPAQDKGYAYLWSGNKLLPGLERWKKIILATDADEKGEILRSELAVRLGRHRCWWITFPEGCKDANDVLIKFGTDVGSRLLRKALEDAKPIVPRSLVKFSDIPVAERKIYSTGWKHLDKFMRVELPSFIVVTGAPSAGKSQWVDALACNLAWEHGLKGATIQFEDNFERKRDDYITFAKNRPNEDGTVMTDKEALEWADRMFVTVAPIEDEDDRDENLDWIIKTIEEAATVHDCKFVVLDPWNEIEHVWDKNETETLYINRAVRALKRAAKRLRIALIVVAHPHVSGGAIEDIEEATLYMISGGASWRNKADIGVILMRQSDFVYVKVGKSKDHLRLGRPGIARMKYRAKEATYEYLGDGK